MGWATQGAPSLLFLVSRRDGGSRTTPRHSAATFAGRDGRYGLSAVAAVDSKVTVQGQNEAVLFELTHANEARVGREPPWRGGGPPAAFSWIAQSCRDLLDNKGARDCHDANGGTLCPNSDRALCDDRAGEKMRSYLSRIIVACAVCLRGVIGTVLSASPLLLVLGCGDLEIREPQDGTHGVRSPLTVRLVGTKPWTLVHVTIDNVDQTLAFTPRSGGAGVATSATFQRLGIGAHTLVATANIDQFYGTSSITKTSEFSIGEQAPSHNLSLTVENFSLISSPVLPIATPDFEWKNLTVMFRSDRGGGSIVSGDVTAFFTPNRGAANTEARASLELPPGGYRLTARAEDAVGYFTTGDVTFNVVAGSAPFCDVPGYELPGYTYQPAGRPVGSQFGGGTWQYVDSTRRECDVVGGVGPLTTPSRRNTVCAPGLPAPVQVENVWTCVTGRGGSPPAAPIVSSSTPECRDNCSADLARPPPCDPGFHMTEHPPEGSSPRRCVCDPCPP
jgi:hypothetical protein